MIYRMTKINDNDNNYLSMIFTEFESVYINSGYLNRHCFDIW